MKAAMIEASKGELRIVAVTILMAWAYISAPSVEGWLMPVISGTEITRIDETDAGSIVYGTADKNRACSFSGIQWVLQGKGGEVDMPVTFLEGAKVRLPGAFEFGPWLVPAKAEAVREHSYALVYHKCHALWKTVTRFYP